jgi:hypothetical protein
MLTPSHPRAQAACPRHHACDRTGTLRLSRTTTSPQCRHARLEPDTKLASAQASRPLHDGPRETASAEPPAWECGRAATVSRCNRADGPQVAGPPRDKLGARLEEQPCSCAARDRHTVPGPVGLFFSAPPCGGRRHTVLMASPPSQHWDRTAPHMRKCRCRSHPDRCSPRPRRTGRWSPPRPGTSACPAPRY